MRGSTGTASIWLFVAACIGKAVCTRAQQRRASPKAAGRCLERPSVGVAQHAEYTSASLRAGPTVGLWMLGFQANHFDDPRLCAHNCSSPALAFALPSPARASAAEDVLVSYHEQDRWRLVPLHSKDCFTQEMSVEAGLRLMRSTGKNAVFNAMHELVAG